MSGVRPETWYRPGGSHAENRPEAPTWIVTGRWPAAVRVTVPGSGRSPGCCPFGLIGPPSMTNRPVRRPVPAAAPVWLVTVMWLVWLVWLAAEHPASASMASRDAQLRKVFMVPHPEVRKTDLWTSSPGMRFREPSAPLNRDLRCGTPGITAAFA